MEDLNETSDELGRVRKTLARTDKYRDSWRKLFEDWNKKQGEEIERLRQENKEQSEQLGISKTKPRLPGQSVPCSQLPMELLTPREVSQTTEAQVPTGSIRETNPGPK